MIKNITLAGRFFSSFLLMALLVFMVALIGLIGINLLGRHIDTLGNNSLPSISGLWKISQGQTQVQSSERALLNPRLSPQDTQLEIARIDNAWKQIKDGFKEYEVTPQTEEEKNLYKKFLKDWDLWTSDHQQYMQLYKKFAPLNIDVPAAELDKLRSQGKQNSPEFATAQTAASLLDQLNQIGANKERISYNTATEDLQGLLDINYQVGKQAIKQADEDISHTRLWIILGMVLGPLTAAIFGYYFTNKIAKPLEKQVQQSGIQVTSSATQIAASGKQLETTVVEQVSSTKEVMATAKQIATTSKQLANTMEQVAAMSQTTAEAAGRGQQNLETMQKTMRNLADSTNVISAKLSTINDKTANINSVITTITKVADQTNLLSLNAAIEAEKAGEFGAGFAVVAREIRRLADQTAVATLEIESMVKDMQLAVSSGVMQMDKFTKDVSQSVLDVGNISGQTEQIIQQVQSLSPRFEVVNQGMELQWQSAEQISEAMIQLTESSGQTVEALREINRAIEHLNEAAQGLRERIFALK